MADWISVKLHENGMAAHHLAANMGIASEAVRAWKNCTAKPEVYHVPDMVRILGKYCHPVQSTKPQ